MGAAAPDIEPALAQREVKSFVIDSREVKAGDVFFALSQPEYRDNGFNGDFDDATIFVKGAFEQGAALCVVRPDRFDEHEATLAEFRHRLAFVPDVIRALQDLASVVYEQWNGPVVGITGSAGKTTAKEIIAHILEKSGRKVLRNIRNFNNGLGHPLTVLNLVADDSYDIAVLEMGMSTPMHEIARLCAITPPDVAVELNVLPVHIEHLGSIENVATAKAELVKGLKPGGTAILNADDARVLAMRELINDPAVTYGIENSADIMAENIDFRTFGETFFDLRTPNGGSRVRFPLNGKHNISNALASVGVAVSFDVSIETIAAALESIATPPQRGEVLHFAKGFTVINDSYNSNPDALRSMVETIVVGKGAARRTIVVAGEMLELGENAATIHRETGKTLGILGIDVLIGVRGLARELVDGARDVGFQGAAFAENSESAGDILTEEVREGDLVLIKGSRGVRTEKVLEKLQERFELEAKGAANG